jgi:hypothetical protein
LTLRIRLITQYFKDCVGQVKPFSSDYISQIQIYTLQDAHEGSGFPNIKWLYERLAWPAHLSYNLLAVVG